MCHRHGKIVFVVTFSRNEGDGYSGNQLLDEDDSASPAIVCFSANIKSQIDFFKTAVKRDRDSANAHFLKEKPDQTYIRFSVPKIQLCTGWNKGCKRSRLNFVIKHCQVTPFGSQKDFGWTGLCCFHRRQFYSISIRQSKINIDYLRPKKTPPLPYGHNRLGAVFAPKYPNTNNVAYVATGSPAYEAGIRNDDILLNQEANGSFEQPAGTKISFTLKRGNKIFKTTAVLRNILPPDTVTNSN